MISEYLSLVLDRTYLSCSQTGESHSSLSSSPVMQTWVESRVMLRCQQ